MAKPTRKPTWATDADPLNNIEPDTALQLSGTPLGGKIGRQHYNWLFGANSEWVDWVQADAMDRTLNLSDITDKPQARINLGASNASNLISGTIPSARLPNATITLNGDVSGSGVMTNLGSVTITTSIPSATTLIEGLVQLNNTTSSTSTTQAATANSVKTTYDLANTANSTANTVADNTGITLVWSSGTPQASVPIDLPIGVYTVIALIGGIIHTTQMYITGNTGTYASSVAADSRVLYNNDTNTMTTPSGGITAIYRVGAAGVITW